MGITMTTSISEVSAAIKAEAERVDKIVIQALSNLGDMCVKEARDRAQQDSWFNQTGNLRSSIGYVVVAHGRIVESSDFVTVLQGLEGSRVGKVLAEERAERFSSNYALIVVAGMHYAEYVEAKENKSVLASAELLAHAEFYNIMEKLKNQIAK